MTIDVSVCIPFAEDWPHLYFTLNNLAVTLVTSKLTHEFIICANNSSQRSLDSIKKLITEKDFCSAHKSQLVISDTPANGPAANMACLKASGKYLCFTDSHVIVYPNIFTECIKVIDRYEDAGLVHAPITWTGIPHDENFNFKPNTRCFQYRYKEWKAGSPDWYLWQHFHGTYNHRKASDEAYPVAGSGHGFFMVKRDTWNKVGGYHPGQRGYGGREPFVTFKMWLFGYRNFVVPATNHIHYNGRRNYQWSMDLWYRNCMQQAYCIGGEKALNIIYEKFLAKPGNNHDVINRLRQEAISGCQYDLASELVSKGLKSRFDKGELGSPETYKIWENSASLGIESSEPIRKFVLDNQKMPFEDLFKVWDEQKVFY
jgi:GT2 family glycosyltransferase